PLSTVLRHLRHLIGPASPGEVTDGHLLHRFVTGRDEAAFAALVQRHGPLVLGVCRRLLRDANDAEDVFQATFLVLVRKARSLDRRGSLAGWLYTVAYRLALRLRADAARRREHERQAATMSPTEPRNDAAWKELAALLDEELNHLPEKYRTPLVLCYLQGK